MLFAKIHVSRKFPKVRKLGLEHGLPIIKRQSGYAISKFTVCGVSLRPQWEKIVSMIKKYHNHKLQTNPWHREEEQHYNHETSGRQTKQSSQLSLPHQDDCKTRMVIK